MITDKCSVVLRYDRETCWGELSSYVRIFLRNPNHLIPTLAILIVWLVPLRSHRLRVSGGFLIGLHRQNTVSKKLIGCIVWWDAPHLTQIITHVTIQMPYLFYEHSFIFEKAQVRTIHWVSMIRHIGLIDVHAGLYWLPLWPDVWSVLIFNNPALEIRIYSALWQ